MTLLQISAIEKNICFKTNKVSARLYLSSIAVVYAFAIMGYQLKHSAGLGSLQDKTTNYCPKLRRYKLHFYTSKILKSLRMVTLLPTFA